MLGFCSTFVSVSLSRAFSVPPPIVTAKLVAFMLPSVFSVKAELLVVPAVAVDVDVVLLLACGVMPKDCGRLMPRLRITSLFTSRMATSTTTSALVRSRSLSSFCTSVSWSAVPRTTIAFWLGTLYILVFSTGRMLRMVATISVVSFCWLTLLR